MMATITLRIDDRTRDEVEAVARGRGVSVSELLRHAIDDLLGRDVELRHEEAPTSLTMYERRMLALQHKILASLAGEPVEEDGDYHVSRVEVLDAGYTAEYSEEFLALESELSRRDSGLVWDILDMFRFLKDSAERLGLDPVPPALTFRGFDANDSFESRLRRYAQFLISTGRWTDMAEHFDRAHEDGNSHMPMLATYRRMLDVFQPIWKAKAGRGFSPDGLLLTTDELDQVLKAWPYPGE